MSTAAAPGEPVFDLLLSFSSDGASLIPVKDHGAPHLVAEWGGTAFNFPRTPENFNKAGAAKLPGHLGVVITEVSEARVVGELPVVESVMAPNGYLHAGTIVTLAFGSKDAMR